MYKLALKESIFLTTIYVTSLSISCLSNSDITYY